VEIQYANPTVNLETNLLSKKLVHNKFISTHFTEKVNQL